MKDPAIRYQSAGAFLADLTLFESDPSTTFAYESEEEEVSNFSEDNSPTRFADDLLFNDEDLDEELSDEEAEDEEEDEKNFKTTWLPIIAGIGTALVLLILFALGVIFQKELFGEKTVACPSVVGIDFELAKGQHNFEFVVGSSVSSDEYAEGVIISQNPVANTQVEKNSTITVVVSTGPASVNKNPVDTSGDNYVPNVVGYTRANAIAEFKRQEISYKIETKNDDDMEEGLVISTYPKAGKEITSETTVIIYISSGPAEEKKPETETVIMPDLSGLSLSVAKTTLKNNKLDVGTVTEEHHDTIKKGEVISQSVLKEKEVDVGTKVNLVISLGPKEETTTPVDGEQTGGETTPPDGEKDPENGGDTNPEDKDPVDGEGGDSEQTGSDGENNKKPNDGENNNQTGSEETDKNETV